MSKEEKVLGIRRYTLPPPARRQEGRRIREVYPLWKDILIADSGKFLGFIIGPGCGTKSWDGPLTKFRKRTSVWAGSKAGLLWNSIYFNVFAVSTLEYIAQLDNVPQAVLDAEQAALRIFAPGPGNWISTDDLENLNCFSIGGGLRTLEPTARASKLRLMRDLGPKMIRAKAASIRSAQLETFRRPFGRWHQQSYASILCGNWSTCKSHGIVIDTAAENFQKIHRMRVVAKLHPFDAEERIRRKMKRWKFKDPVAAKLAETFRLLNGRVPPAAIASYLRALWNGLPTSRRMATCQGFHRTQCVFHCSTTADDSLEHYCRCPALKAAFARLTNDTVDCIDDFFGVRKGMDISSRVNCAKRVRVTCRAIQLARISPDVSLPEIVQLEWNSL